MLNAQEQLRYAIAALNAGYFVLPVDPPACTRWGVEMATLCDRTGLDPVTLIDRITNGGMKTAYTQPIMALCATALAAGLAPADIQAGASPGGSFEALMKEIQETANTCWPVDSKEPKAWRAIVWLSLFMEEAAGLISVVRLHPAIYPETTASAFDFGKITADRVEEQIGAVFMFMQQFAAMTGANFERALSDAPKVFARRLAIEFPEARRHG